jgi:hypothetical protein
MKKLNLYSDPKIEPGFIVPEHYFENFSTVLLQKLPQNDEKKISIFTRNKTWFYSAAAILILALSLPFYNWFLTKTAEIEETSLENYITYESSISTNELVNLLDQNDIEKIKIDLKIDHANIETELYNNSDIEEYILN